MSSRSRLIIIAGLPGSGKSTLARSLESSLPALRLSADDWMDSLGINLHAERDRERIETLQWQLAQTLLKIGNIVIVEWGAWSKSERDTLRTRARDLGAAVELHYLTAPLPELYRRIQSRGKEDPPIRWEDIQSWEALIEPPTPEECHMTDWFTRPVFHVTDVVASLGFYIDKLGFTTSWKYEEDGKLRIAQVERPGCAVILSDQWPHKVGKGLLFVSLNLEPEEQTAELNRLRAEFQSHGVHVKDGSWGYRLLVVDDPDGNQLYFNYPHSTP